MYINLVILRDIRGFRTRLPGLMLVRRDGGYAGWTVIAGRNGSGKSTFLRAVALASAGLNVVRGLQQSFAGWISLGESQAVAVVGLITHKEDLATGRARVPHSVTLAIGWSRQSGPEPTLRLVTEDEIVDLGEMEKIPDVLDQGPWATNPKGWFIAGYGPYRRLSGQMADAARFVGGPLSLSRLVNLFHEDAPLVEGVQWLRELHLRRLENRQGAAELLDAVLKLLDDQLLTDTRVEKVDSEGLWVRRGGFSLPLREMSDGYRSVVAVVLDIVRQLHATYGTLKLELQNGRACVTHPGVILIDEVELHLHVSWQRRIGFWFKEHFPYIQFIVTTHSPFVCQAADVLIRLPAPGEDRSAEHVSDELYKTVVNGTVDEAVLTELFGLEHVHSEQSERLREQVAQLEARVIEGEATPEDREELERLAAQLPNTGSAIVDRAVRKFGLDK